MYQFIKRAFDIVLSAMFLVGFCWLYLIIIIAIKIDDPGSAFFHQKRVGKKKNGVITYLHDDKFYTGHYRAKTA